MIGAANVFIIAFLAALALPAEAQLRAGRAASEEHRTLVSLKFVGADPSGMLGQCEGDCDNDGQCQSGLVCYQKDAGSPGTVPGCQGTDTSRNDYCIDPADLSTPPTGSPPTGPSPTPPAPTPSSSSSLQDFKLKLYWEEGYYWQEETFERKWCMRCRGGHCSIGENLYLEECSDNGVQKFDFEYVNDQEVLIKLHDTDRCLEKYTSNSEEWTYSLYVQNCDSGNSEQRFFAKSGGFDEYRFEISLNVASNLCVTNRHHPKAGEEVHLESCRVARSSDTSYWERCNTNSC